MRPWHNKLQLSILGLVTGLLLLTSNPARARSATNACPDLNFTAANLVVNPLVLNYTVSNFDPSWFDKSSSSAPLFTLQIIPPPGVSPDSMAGRVRLWMRISADLSLTTDQKSSFDKYQTTVLDQVTLPLNATDIGVPLTSGHVFGMPVDGSDPSSKKFEESELYDLVINQHQAPEFNLFLRFTLTCEDGGINSQPITLSFTDKNNSPFRTVNNIQALTPGTNISNPSPVVVNTQTPVFQISSRLIDTATFDHPPGESNMEIFLYEIRPDENPAYALEGQEFARFSADNFQVPYPSGLSMLEPGKVYAWRARGLLRGPESDYLYSNALYFQVNPALGGGGEGGGSSFTEPPESIISLETLEGQVKAGDDYGKRVLAALKIILGENFEILRLAQTKMTPAKGAIRLNGRPYALEDLERLAKDFQQSSHGITRLRFQ